MLPRMLPLRSMLSLQAQAKESSITETAQGSWHTLVRLVKGLVRTAVLVWTFVLFGCVDFVVSRPFFLLLTFAGCLTPCLSFWFCEIKSESGNQSDPHVWTRSSNLQYWDEQRLPFPSRLSLSSLCKRNVGVVSCRFRRGRAIIDDAKSIPVYSTVI